MPWGWGSRRCRRRTSICSGPDRRGVLDLQRSDRHAVAPAAVGAVLGACCPARTGSPCRSRRSRAARPRPSSRSSSRRRRPCPLSRTHAVPGGEAGIAVRVGVGEHEILVRRRDVPELREDRVAAGVRLARLGDDAVGAEWHWSFTVDGMPASESSTAGSSNPLRPPSWGSSRKIARGLRQAQRPVPVGEVRGDDAAEGEAEVARPAELRLHPAARSPADTRARRGCRGPRRSCRARCRTDPDRARRRRSASAGR